MAERLTPDERVRAVYLLAFILLAGCARTDQPLTEKQKFEMAKQCIENGMIPDVWQYTVRCDPVPKSGASE